MKKRLLLLGNIKSKTAMYILFYLMIIPIISNTYQSSRLIFKTLNFYVNYSESSPMDTTTIIDTFVSNYNNDIIPGNDLGSIVVFFIIFVLECSIVLVVWKMICELLLKAFLYFEVSYTDKLKEEKT